MNGENIIYTAAGLLVAGYLWKGRAIRAELSMTGAGWNNLDPEVQRRAKDVIHDANKAFKPQGLSVGMFEGWRTEARQREVMSAGTSNVIDPNSSYHRWGLAVDFVFINRLGAWTWQPFDKHECAWYDLFCRDPNKEAWTTLGDIIKKHGFEWGGDWRHFDGPHAQYTEYGRIAQLKADYGAPENFVV